MKPVKPAQPNVVFNRLSARVEPIRPGPANFHWAGLETDHKPENPAHEQGDDPWGGASTLLRHVC